MDTHAEKGRRQRDPSFARHIIGALLVMLSGVFLIVSLGLSHSMATLGGVLLASLALLAVSGIRLCLKLAVIALAILSVTLLPQLLAVKDGSSTYLVIDGAQGIRLGLERYSIDCDQSYPISVSQLQEQGYFSQFPENPLNRQPVQDLSENLTEEQIEMLRHMQPLGDSSLPEGLHECLEWPGNFCYLPRIEADSTGGYTATGFSLLAFDKKLWDPGWWDTPYVMPIVVYYYNSETGIEKTWE